MAYQDSITIVHTFIHYEIDDLITSASSRCPLERGKVYRVTDFIPPIQSECRGTVFVEGERWGVSAEYVRIPNDDELDAYWEEQ